MPLPSAKPLTREYRIYLALWRKAERERETPHPAVSLRVPTRSLALAVRTGMYKAIKPYRDTIAHDEELLAASEHFVVSSSQDPDGSYTITLMPRLSLTELDAQLDALGLTEDDLALPEEKSVPKLLEELMAPKEATTRVTPFYTRED